MSVRFLAGTHRALPAFNASWRRILPRSKHALEPAGDADEGDAEDADAEADAATDAPEKRLAASAVSGQTSPAGPEWQRGLSPLTPRALAYDKLLCAKGYEAAAHPARRLRRI